ncbi:MAG: hypothetical protein NT159_15115 [Proteobacteria bacterium]|nr:hypothetical protein [Pseudomonadota bacterium]
MVIVKHILRGILPALLWFAAGPASAWSNHALGTWQALSVMPEMKSAAPVKVERLETFLAAEDVALEKVLAQEEAWVRANVPVYPPRPEALAFRSSGQPAELRQRFISAVRINPELKLNLFLQLRPGEQLNGRPGLPWAEVTTLRGETTAREITFQDLAEGDTVAPLDVLATASDEPDYGMDLGLWENNETAYGKTYGFGKQPFGNPALEFSSQAPFHMGFYHEAGIIYLAAGFLKRTYPEYRIHLWQTLAVHALRSGHAYWGWRFAGWALHYQQDLSQPYHARVLPGVGVARMLWINSVDLLGYHAAKDHAITLVSNRHLALENYQYHRMRAAYLRPDPDDALMLACRDTARDLAYAPYDDNSPRQVIAKEAQTMADAADTALEQSLPAHYIADPGYDFGKSEKGVDIFEVSGKSPQSAQQALTGLTAELLRNVGAHTRSLVRSLLARSGASR